MSSPAAAAELLARGPVDRWRRVLELVCDLCLGEALVAAGAASRVVFHLKGHPTFVSDAMAKDVRGHFAALRADAVERPASAVMAARWEALVADGRWELREDFFWAQPTPFWAMPARLAAGLEGFKGAPLQHKWRELALAGRLE